MVSRFELIFFGGFLLILWRYFLPKALDYIRIYGATKKEQYQALLGKEGIIRKKAEKLEKLCGEKNSELDSLVNRLDLIFEQNLSDFRKKNESQLELYKKNENSKLKLEISKAENEVIDSCFEILENEVYSKLKHKNITCFETALEEIKELLKKS